jgi:hypothetical protein
MKHAVQGHLDSRTVNATVKRISPLDLGLVLVLLVGPGVRDMVRGASSVSADFFPVAVWYSGGKARAPMLEPVTAASADAWRTDLLKFRLHAVRQTSEVYLRFPPWRC